MKKINVMVAGLSAKPNEGKMAKLVAEAILRHEDMLLYHHGLAEESGDVSLDIPAGKVEVHLDPMDNHALVLAGRRNDIDLIVDFTQPKSVNRNAELYCAVGIPFVMGTTGGDRPKLGLTVSASDISAVIATNFAAPVVMFQEMVRFAAKNFAGSLHGFKLLIRESHQEQKPDPSGTAVSLLDAFAELGTPLKKEQIIMVRDPLFQAVNMDIPIQYLGGHGYHTYTLLSPDGTVKLEFKHNVLGRSVYVDGALRAIRFLAGFGRKGIQGKVFSMIDVLRG